MYESLNLKELKNLCIERSIYVTGNKTMKTSYIKALEANDVISVGDEAFIDCYEALGFDYTPIAIPTSITPIGLVETTIESLENPTTKPVGSDIESTPLRLSAAIVIAVLAIAVYCLAVKLPIAIVGVILAAVGFIGWLLNDPPIIVWTGSGIKTYQI